MNEIARFLKRLSVRERSIVHLEDALIEKRFGAYAWYRLRYYSAAQVWIFAIHLVEFFILRHIFSNLGLVSVLVAQNLCSLAATFSWGGLEVFREKVRALRGRKQKARVVRLCAPWFAGVGTLALLVISLGAGYLLYKALNRRAVITLYDSFVVAMLFKLALELVNRTFHSAVFAVRRVFRPMVAILFSETFVFLFTWLLWKPLRFWAFSVSIVIASALAFGIGFYFNLRAWRLLRLPHLRPHLRYLIRARLSPGDLVGFLTAGAAFSLNRVGSILVIALGVFAARDDESQMIVVLFHLTNPVISAASNWPYLFYFDYKRLASEGQARLYEWFERSVGRLSWGIGFACGIAASAIVLGLVPQPSVFPFAAVLAVFLLVRSRLAAALMASFSRAHYNRMIAAAVPLLLMAVFFLGGGPTWTTRMLDVTLLLGLFVVLMAILTWAMEQGFRPIGRSPRESAVQSPVDWIESLKSLATTMPAVRIFRLYFEGGSSGIKADGLRLVEERVQDKGGAVTWVSPGCIFWYEPSGESPSAFWPDWFVRLGGLARLIEEGNWAGGGADPLSRLIERSTGPFPGTPPAMDDPSWDADRMDREFEKRFPRGLRIRPTEACREIRSLSHEDRGTIWREALRFASLRLHRAGRKPAYDVTALAPSGQITRIYLVQRDEPPEARSDWRRSVLAVNLARLKTTS